MSEKNNNYKPKSDCTCRSSMIWVYTVYGCKSFWCEHKLVLLRRLQDCTDCLVGKIVLSFAQSVALE